MPGGFAEAIARFFARREDEGVDEGSSVGRNDGAGSAETYGERLLEEIRYYGLNPHPGEDVRGLGQKQELFSFFLTKLLKRAYDMGFHVRMGETLRTEEQQQIYLRAGKTRVSRSLHQDKLAVDLNLTKGGRLITQSEEHLPLGEWWEKLHPLCRWGGRFGDGNHYSLTHGGRK